MTAIPDRENPEVYRETAFTEERFVLLTERDFDICMQYPKLGMECAEERCLLREGTVACLQRANELLPEGLHLRIWDAWRPLSLQKELFEKYTDRIVEQFHLENVSKEERMRVLSLYVSHPVADKVCPPLHTTGGAVDVTLVDSLGNELLMGTGFDAFTERTKTSYFESELVLIDDRSSMTKEDVRLIRDNRRILYHAMTQAGFTGLPSEWWHYDYGDRCYAYYTGQPAIYRGEFTVPEYILRQ